MATWALPKDRTRSFASKQLDRGNVYTRADLRELFQITAGSINTGVFKPSALDSVWLFITEEKTKDRTQYHDILTGDVLHMDGQELGRTDYLIKEQLERGLELLVFYRKNRKEYPGAGFVFEGKFLYHSHHGTKPTKFTLHREISKALMLDNVETELEAQGAFDPSNLIDARKRTLASIVRRQGQAKFRKQLLSAYSGKCAVTGCAVEALLEAAHIVPYQGSETNVVTNGLLLRADIHTLFDLGLLWINPGSLLVEVAELLKQSEYGSLASKPIGLPALASDRPSVEALQSRLDLLVS